MMRFLLVFIPPAGLWFKRSFFFVAAFRAPPGIAETSGARAFLIPNSKNKGTVALDTGNDEIFHFATSGREMVSYIIIILF